MRAKQYLSSLLETPLHGSTEGLGDTAAAGRAHGRRLAALALPADREYLALARMSAMHVAGLLDFPVGSVIDLRLAVDEACSVFLAGPDGHGQAEQPGAAPGMLELAFETDGAQLQVTVRGAAPPHWPEPDDVGWAMLKALVGELRAEVDDGLGTLTLIGPLPRAR